MSKAKLAPLPPNTVLHGYTIVRQVSEGGFSLVYLARFRNTLWIYGVYFTFFYMFVLAWQTFYALLTVRRNHWGTR